MKALALLLAAAFFILGLLYGLGKIEFLTRSGEAHSHHISHLVVCWVIALLALVWYRFQSSSSPSRRL
jgi:FtsH-binding integral membrane protein